jgi:hypothetical protein
MEKVNLSEILKHCPEGIKLWTDLYGEVELVGGEVGIAYPISIKTNVHNTNVGYTATGAYQADINGDDTLPCILWPDSRRTWDEWQKIIMPQCVGKVIVDCAGDGYLVGKSVMYSERGISIQDGVFEYSNARFADEKEEVNFLLRLGENGFVWNKEQMKMERPLSVEKKSSKLQPKDEQPDSEPTELEPAVLDSDEADRLYEEYKKFFGEDNECMPQAVQDYITSAYRVALDDIIKTYKGQILKIGE